MQRNNTNKKEEEKATYTEEFSVKGDKLIEKLKELLKEGNIRRVTIKNSEGKIIFDFPLTIGVVGVVLIPFWSAVAAIAALASHLTISIEKKEEK